MTIQHERLISIIEFAQQSARLSARSAATVTQHNSFSLFEHKAQGRPAVHFNETEQGADREIWLAVERLHETAPPDCQNGILRSWITVGTGPDIEPTLRTGVQEILLLEADNPASPRRAVSH